MIGKKVFGGIARIPVRALEGVIFIGILSLLVLFVLGGVQGEKPHTDQAEDTQVLREA